MTQGAGPGAFPEAPQRLHRGFTEAPWRGSVRHQGLVQRRLRGSTEGPQRDQSPEPETRARDQSQRPEPARPANQNLRVERVTIGSE